MASWTCLHIAVARRLVVNLNSTPVVNPPQLLALPSMHHCSKLIGWVSALAQTHSHNMSCTLLATFQRVQLNHVPLSYKYWNCSYCAMLYSDNVPSSENCKSKVLYMWRHIFQCSTHALGALRMNKYIALRVSNKFITHGVTTILSLVSTMYSIKHTN